MQNSTQRSKSSEPRRAFGRIDVHSHLLPGVDDGCESLDDSLQCAQMLVAAGYTHSFCTPHVWANLPDVTPVNVAEWTAELQAELDTAGIPLTLLPGGEINLRGDLPDTMPPESIITFGLKRRHLLIDMWADRIPGFFKPNVKWLQSHGITVILAHPERMRAVQHQPSLAEEFTEMGILLQGNLQCLGDPPASPTRETAERYLLEDRYFLLGSDCHKSATLQLRIDGLARAGDLVGPAKVDQLTMLNPRKLLAE